MSGPLRRVRDRSPASRDRIRLQNDLVSGDGTYMMPSDRTSRFESWRFATA